MTEPTTMRGTGRNGLYYIKLMIISLHFLKLSSFFLSSFFLRSIIDPSLPNRSPVLLTTRGSDGLDSFDPSFYPWLSSWLPAENKDRSVRWWCVAWLSSIWDSSGFGLDGRFYITKTRRWCQIEIRQTKNVEENQYLSPEVLVPMATI